MSFRHARDGSVRPGDSSASLPMIPQGSSRHFSAEATVRTGAKAPPPVASNFVRWYLLHLVFLAVWWPSVTVWVGRASQIGPCPSNPFEYYAGCLTRSQGISVLVAFLALPAGVLFMGLALQATALLGAGAARHMAVALVTMEAAAHAAAALYFLATPQYTWDTTHFDGLRTLHGGMGTSMFLLMTIAGMRTMMRRPFAAAVAGVDHSKPGTRPRAFEPSQARHNVPRALALLFLLFLVTFSTTVFTPIWNNAFVYYSVTDSPYSWVHTTVPGVVRPYSDVDGYVSPEAPVYFKLFTDVLVYFGFLTLLIGGGLLSHLWRPCRTRMHRRVRVCAPRPKKWWRFFPHGAAVGELVLIGLVACLYAFWFGYWGFMYKRIQLDAYTPDTLHPGKPAQSHDPHPFFNIAGRTVGHLATLSVSFLAFPASRGSLWESVFGMPFERAIKYHRVFGFSAWFFTSLHALTWYTKWALEDSLGQNLIHSGLRVIIWQTPGEAWTIDNSLVHMDNFTLLLCQVAWIGVTIMTGLALFTRRTKYELFYYAHHFAIFYFLTAILHAWTFWFYAAGPLILWGADKSIRALRGSTPPRLLSMTHANGVTRLVFAAPSAGRFYAGQYCFVNVPAVSALQWHPFSISSAPSDGLLSFHIKNMGPGTWTARLAELAAGAPTVAPVASPAPAHHVRVDGPYGRASYLTSSSRVLVLCAGGIGITPMHSIFRELLLRTARARGVKLPKPYPADAGAGAVRAESGEGAGSGGASHRLGLLGGVPGTSLQRVVLVWTVRETVALAPFSETILAALHPELADTFEVRLHSTQKTEVLLPQIIGTEAGAAGPSVMPGSTAEGLRAVYDMVRRGRPKMEPVFDEATALARPAAGDVGAQEGTSGPGLRPPRVMAAVCGPMPMVDQISELAFRYGAGFHTEEFAF